MGVSQIYLLTIFFFHSKANCVLEKCSTFVLTLCPKWDICSVYSLRESLSHCKNINQVFRALKSRILFFCSLVGRHERAKKCQHFMTLFSTVFTTCNLALCSDLTFVATPLGNIAVSPKQRQATSHAMISDSWNLRVHMTSHWFT
jgi:hypothetical protein